jgi:hypothetical protein
MPLAFTLYFDASAVDQLVQRVCGAAIRDFGGMLFRRRDSVLKSGTAQFRTIRCNRLSTNPVV